MRTAAVDATESERWDPNSIYRLKSSGGLRWSFQKFSTPGVPLSMVSCTLEGPEITSFGHGDAFLTRNAMIAAFAEAWERYWLLKAIRNPGSFPFHPDSSNGFAAGQTNGAAIQKSREELIERGIFLNAWQDMAGWQPYSPRSISFRFLRALLERSGWSVETYLLSDDQFGEVLAAFSHHAILGTRFDTKFIGKGKNPTQVESRLMHSLIRTISTTYGGSASRSYENLPQTATPRDHGTFYTNPKHRTAFTFLQSPESTQKASGLGATTAIQSYLICSAGEFPAVAVSGNPQWQPLLWGAQSVRGKNPWPHPLA